MIDFFKLKYAWIVSKYTHLAVIIWDQMDNIELTVTCVRVCTGQTVINGESLPHVVSGVHPYSGIGKYLTQ